MIAYQDRSGWFGASDTERVMGNWNTKTFAAWWAVKLGIMRQDYQSKAMRAGTNYEHRILAFIGVTKMDRQIKHPSLRLRVNLDGEDADTVYEVKTYGGERFTVSRRYWMQCQIQMFVTGKRCQIIAYRLNPEDYTNYFNPIDPARLSRHDIDRDSAWITGEWLPRIQYLAKTLRKGGRPDENERLKFRAITPLWRRLVRFLPS